MRLRKLWAPAYTSYTCSTQDRFLPHFRITTSPTFVKGMRGITKRVSRNLREKIWYFLRTINWPIETLWDKMRPNEKTVPHIGGEAPNVRYCSLRGSHFVSMLFMFSQKVSNFLTQISWSPFRDAPHSFKDLLRTFDLLALLTSIVARNSGCSPFKHAKQYK